MMNEALKRIGVARVLPVVTIENEFDAEPVADALLAGGLDCIEIVLRTPSASKAIGRLRKSRPEMLVGAGTVLTIEQLRSVTSVGAQFIVSPGLSQQVVESCVKSDVPVMPGVVTPTEIGRASEMGLEIVKFFPAEASGGVSYLRAVAAVFPAVKFVPTGGISQRNLLDYLNLPSVFSCGGSWMVHHAMIREKRFSEISAATRKAVESAAGIKQVVLV
jgi:2-dehydro-3-deoxyphosphogluconate aldolase/(4S)-4-hydroxy-2-oxoglutarate aldolase